MDDVNFSLPDSNCALNPITAAQQMTARVNEHKKRRRDVREQIEANYNSKLADVRSRLQLCLNRHGMNGVHSRQAQLNRLLDAIAKRNAREAAMCKKLVEVRNQCTNLAKQFRVVYAGREGLAQITS